MFCQNCGKEIAENAAFCPHCGAKNENAQTAPSTPVSGNKTEAFIAEKKAQQQPVTPPAPPVQAAPAAAQPAPQQVPPINPAPAAQPMPQQAPPVNSAYTAPRAPQGAPQPPFTPAAQQAPAQQPFVQGGYTPAYPAATPPVQKKSRAGIIVGIVAGVFAVIAVIVIVVLFSAKPEKQFYGEWKATMDYTELFESSFAANKQYLDKDIKFELEMKFVFQKDGTYEVTVEDASIKAAEATYKECIETIFFNTVRQSNKMFQNYTDEQIKALYEKSAGQTFEEYIDSVAKSVNFSAIKEKGHLKGNYQVDEEHFYLSSGTDKQVDENIYAVYQVQSDTAIRVTDYIINGESSDDVFMTPFTMQKVK